jgi:uncharacterized LabA/DUF88 family protein
LTIWFWFATIAVQSPALGRSEHRGAFLVGVISVAKYLLIDGENFVHKLAHCLRQYGLIKTRAGLKKYNIKQLLPDEGLIINYYATMVKLPNKNHNLFKKVENIRRWNSVWVPYIVNQGINYIKAGSLKIRDGKKCPKCGSRADVLLEKGVDVRLAVDLVDIAKKDDTIYLLSSDTDLLPAIERATSKGVKIVYTAFPRQIVKLISKKSDSTMVLKKKDIVRGYRKANR